MLLLLALLEDEQHDRKGKCEPLRGVLLYRVDQCLGYLIYKVGLVDSGSVDEVSLSSLSIDHINQHSPSLVRDLHLIFIVCILEEHCLAVERTFLVLGISRFFTSCLCSLGLYIKVLPLLSPLFANVSLLGQPYFNLSFVRGLSILCMVGALPHETSQQFLTALLGKHLVDSRHLLLEEGLSVPEGG